MVTTKHLQPLLQTAQKCNLKLNYDKPQYKQDKVEFFGETYTTSGHKPSKDKVSAITAMPLQPIPQPMPHRKAFSINDIIFL